MTIDPPQIQPANSGEASLVVSRADSGKDSQYLQGGFDFLCENFGIGSVFKPSGAILVGIIQFVRGLNQYLRRH